jgi:hypothetical protein
MAKRPGDNKYKESIKRPKTENEADEEGSELRRQLEMLQNCSKKKDRNVN